MVGQEPWPSGRTEVRAGGRLAPSLRAPHRTSSGTPGSVSTCPELRSFPGTHSVEFYIPRHRTGRPRTSAHSALNSAVTQGSRATREMKGFMSLNSGDSTETG